MDTVYKLTRQDNTTKNGFLYKQGEIYQFSGDGPLCSAAWSHAYLSPALAAFLWPSHVDSDYTKLWQAEGIIGARDHQLKVGCSQICLIEEVEFPQPTLEQRITFAILCGQKVYLNSTWQNWATNWLSGKDRSGAAAGAAEAAAGAAAGAAWAAAWAAWAAEAATGAAAGADKIDLISIADECLQWEDPLS